MAKLASFVYVRDEAGAIHLFGPEDEVPTWAEEQITNPAAWEETPQSKESTSSRRTTSAKKSDDNQE